MAGCSNTSPHAPPGRQRAESTIDVFDSNGKLVDKLEIEDQDVTDLTFNGRDSRPVTETTLGRLVTMHWEHRGRRLVQGQSVCDRSVTATIYADNYFELYVNGEQVAVDPLDFTPHQAVRVSFNVPADINPVYAIFASDFATVSGYEYTSPDRPQLGNGGLIAVFSDGRATDASWKCRTVSYGPTEASEEAGCSADSLATCEVVESRSSVGASSGLGRPWRRHDGLGCEQCPAGHQVLPYSTQ